MNNRYDSLSHKLCQRKTPVYCENMGKSGGVSKSSWRPALIVLAHRRNIGVLNWLFFPRFSCNYHFKAILNLSWSLGYQSHCLSFLFECPSLSLSLDTPSRAHNTHLLGHLYYYICLRSPSIICWLLSNNLLGMRCYQGFIFEINCILIVLTEGNFDVC